MQEPNATRPTIPASWIVAGIACAVALVAITWLVAGRGNGGHDPDMQQLMSRLDALESRNQGSRPQPAPARCRADPPGWAARTVRWGPRWAGR